MTETWKATREGVEKLRSSWLEASDDTKFEVIWWTVSIFGMFACAIWALGWPAFWFGIFWLIKNAMQPK